MKKLAAMLVLMLSVMSLAGCFKPIKEAASTDGTVSVSGVEVNIDEYTGVTAKTEIPSIGVIDYYLCSTMEVCDHNTAGVSVDDMTTFKGGSKYYTQYHGTKITLYVPYEDDMFIESHAELEDVGLMSVEAVVEQMYNTSAKLCLTDTIQQVKFNNTVVVNVAEHEFAVRKDEIVIPGLVRIRKDDGSITTKEQEEIGNTSVGKTSNSKYDYYQYNGVVIQAMIGTDVSSLITFKE